MIKKGQLSIIYAAPKSTKVGLDLWLRIMLSWKWCSRCVRMTQHDGHNCKECR